VIFCRNDIAMSKKHTQCPNLDCQEHWGVEEVDFQECDSCGWPDVDAEAESHDGLCEHRTGHKATAPAMQSAFNFVIGNKPIDRWLENEKQTKKGDFEELKDCLKCFLEMKVDIRYTTITVKHLAEKMMLAQRLGLIDITKMEGNKVWGRWK